MLHNQISSTAVQTERSADDGGCESRRKHLSFRVNVKFGASTPLFSSEIEILSILVILYKIPVAKFLFLPAFAHGNMLPRPKLPTSGSIPQCGTAWCSTSAVPTSFQFIYCRFAFIERWTKVSLKATSSSPPSTFYTQIKRTPQCCCQIITCVTVSSRTSAG